MGRFACEPTCALPAFSLIAPTEDHHNTIEVLRCPRVPRLRDRGVDTYIGLAAIQAEGDAALRSTACLAGANHPSHAGHTLRGANVRGHWVTRNERPRDGNVRAAKLSCAGIRIPAHDLETIERTPIGAASDGLPWAFALRLLIVAGSRTTRMWSVSRNRCFHPAVDTAEEAARAVGAREIQVAVVSPQPWWSGIFRFPTLSHVVTERSP